MVGGGRQVSCCEACLCRTSLVVLTCTLTHSAPSTGEDLPGWYIKKVTKRAYNTTACHVEADSFSTIIKIDNVTGQVSTGQGRAGLGAWALHPCVQGNLITPHSLMSHDLSAHTSFLSTQVGLATVGPLDWFYTINTTAVAVTQVASEHCQGKVSGNINAAAQYAPIVLVMDHMVRAGESEEREQGGERERGGRGGGGRGDLMRRSSLPAAPILLPLALTPFSHPVHTLMHSLMLGLPAAHLLCPDLCRSSHLGGPGVLHRVCAGAVQPGGPTGERPGLRRTRAVERGERAGEPVVQSSVIRSLSLSPSLSLCVCPTPPSSPLSLSSRSQTVIVTLLLAMCALQFTYDFPPAGYLNVVQQVRACAM